MARCLYFDCSTGISGDMAVAAMIGLGADREGLLRMIDGLGLDGVTVRISEVEKSGIKATDFDVELAEGNPDHDARYLYGGAPEEEHHGHHRHHEHRSPADIAAIIDASSLTENAKAIAHRILDVVAKAESEAHGVPVDQVHFHEVGAKDSIVDIASLAFCLDDLDVDQVCFSPLVEGTGTVRCQHGVLPVPVPAVVNIVRDSGLRMSIADRRGEYVTPTGAAFAAAARTRDPPSVFTIERVGIGAGKRDQEVPGLLRAMIVADAESDTVIKLECNVDDCTGEMLGYTMERLFAAGAREVNFTPVYMKKDRPAWLLTVICHDAERGRLEDVIFRETSTIGIRRCRMERTVLDRSIVQADTPWGKVRVKVSEGPGLRRGYPEYEDVAAIARREGVPFQEVYRTAMRSSGLRGQVREDERPHALPEVPEPEPRVLHRTPHDALGVREAGPADAVEVDGDEQLLRMGGGAVEALRQPAAHALGAPVGRVGEPGDPLGGDVVRDDRCQHVAVHQVVGVVDAHVGPPLGELRGRRALRLREGVAQRVVVAVHGVLDQLEEDVLLRLDVPVQVGAGPGQLIGDQGQGDVGVGHLVVQGGRGPLDLLHADLLLLRAPSPDEVFHGVRRFASSI